MASTATVRAAEEAGLLFLHAHTSLHPGCGTALGTVDLPVQRERHTRWPTIAGSALKGILRDACREKAKEQYEDMYDEGKLIRTRRRAADEEDPMLVAVFGPGKVEESNAHAGALSVTDARILAYPVRSLRGVFAWVTCPAVLERLDRDLALAGIEAPPLLKPPERDEALVPPSSPLLVDRNKIVLEEFDFTRSGDSQAVAHWIAPRAVADEGTRQRMKTHLVVLHDDDFTHFVEHATEVVARIALDYERKTVKSGALFYQEFLPPETVFYSVVLAQPSRRNAGARSVLSAAEVLQYVQSCVEEVKVLQIGGDETTGKGLCAVRLEKGGAA